MVKHIYSTDGSTLLLTEEDNPICGMDFCDRCGDCLACFDGDGCIDGREEHFWVEYLTN